MRARKAEANKQSEHEKSKNRSHEQSGAAQPYHPPTISIMSASWLKQGCGVREAGSFSMKKQKESRRRKGKKRCPTPYALALATHTSRPEDAAVDHARGAAGGERKRVTSDPHGDRARRHAPDAQRRRILPRAALRIEGLHACEGTVAPQPTWSQG